MRLQRQTPAKAAHDDWLAELNLTADQREKMKAIWTEAMKATGGQEREKRDAARKERDEALRALVTGEQKERLEEVLSAYQKKMEAISQESGKARDEARERTRALLSESQRVQYDELWKKRMESHGRPRPEGGKGRPDSEKAGSSVEPGQKKPEETQQAK
jgi:Spy/CpxP family protein refolding chaperone